MAVVRKEYDVYNTDGYAVPLYGRSEWVIVGNDQGVI